MLTLASDPSLRKSLISKGLLKAKQFSWAKSAQILLEAINQLS
jgi:hypothetical protein